MLKNWLWGDTLIDISTHLNLLTIIELYCGVHKCTRYLISFGIKALLLIIIMLAEELFLFKLGLILFL